MVARTAFDKAIELAPGVAKIGIAAACSLSRRERSE